MNSRLRISSVAATFVVVVVIVVVIVVAGGGVALGGGGVDSPLALTSSNVAPRDDRVASGSATGRASAR